MTHDIPLSKAEYHLIPEFEEWCKQNLPPNPKGFAWTPYQSARLPKDWYWGIWWMLGMGGVVFKDPSHASEFEEFKVKKCIAQP